MTDLQKISQLPLTNVNIHDLLISDVEQFQSICKHQPDLVPQFVTYADSQIAYMVGYWWLSLDEGQKKAALEKHPIFAEKYSFETCMRYGKVGKKIPTGVRTPVVEKINMMVSDHITRATSDESELEILFNVALATNISARNIQSVIAEWKSDKSLGQVLIKRLPEVIEGDRKDKSRLEQLILN